MRSWQKTVNKSSPCPRHVLGLTAQLSPSRPRFPWLHASSGHQLLLHRSSSCLPPPPLPCIFLAFSSGPPSVRQANKQRGQNESRLSPLSESPWVINHALASIKKLAWRAGICRDTRNLRDRGMADGFVCPSNEMSCLVGSSLLGIFFFFPVFNP